MCSNMPMWLIVTPEGLIMPQNHQVTNLHEKFQINSFVIIGVLCLGDKNWI